MSGQAKTKASKTGARRQKKQEDVSTWKHPGPEQDNILTPERDDVSAPEHDDVSTPEPDDPTPEQDAAPEQENVSTWKHSPPEQEEGSDAIAVAPLTNSPESQGLSAEDAALFEAARNADATLKRTFEDHWLPVARAVARAREIVDQRGGGKMQRSKAFRQLLAQQGLSAFGEDRATCSKLVTIIEHLDKVKDWRAKLTPQQRIKWASPSSIHAFCPDLKKLKPKSTRKPTTLPNRQMPTEPVLEPWVPSSRPSAEAMEAKMKINAEAEATELAAEDADDEPDTVEEPNVVAALKARVAELEGQIASASRDGKADLVSLVKYLLDAVAAWKWPADMPAKNKAKAQSALDVIRTNLEVLEIYVPPAATSESSALKGNDEQATEASEGDGQ